MNEELQSDNKDNDKIDIDKLPEELMKTSTETLSDLQRQPKPAAQPASAVAAPFEVPAVAAWIAPFSA